MTLKILAKKSTRHELDVLKRVAEDDHAKDCIIELLDDLKLSCEGFSYRCLVLETLWQQLTGFCQVFDPHELLLVTKHISCRILRGLESLNRLGIIHNGNCHGRYFS